MYFLKEDLKNLFSRINQHLLEEERIAEKVFDGLFQAVYNTYLESLLTDALNAQDDAKSVTQKLLDLSQSNQTLLKDLLFELQKRCPQRV